VGQVAPTFGVLGVLEVSRDGVPVALPAGRRRAVLPPFWSARAGRSRRMRSSMRRGGQTASRPQVGAADRAVPAARRPTWC